VDSLTQLQRMRFGTPSILVKQQPKPSNPYISKSSRIFRLLQIFLDVACKPRIFTLLLFLECVFMLLLGIYI